ncbi:hypothetical protein WA026_003345 [Henosepilachna vigintioctopunctata]|uniref:Cytochrome P450 n=1 Tax=Henosepilachna vigintioctopunctata TaxID=420089 RepID=A0AAW1TPB5_9CUCU
MLLVGVVIIIVFFSLIRIYLKFKKKYKYWEKRGVKVIQPIFPFGNVLSIFTKKIGITQCILEWYESLDAKVIGLYAIDDPILLVKDPDIMKNILVKDFNHFTDRGVYIDKREPTAGHLWKLPGPKWKPLRTKMSPCFSIKKLKMIFSNLLHVGKEMGKSLEDECKKTEGIINVEKLCQCFTVDIVSSSIFGVETNSFLDKDNMYLKMEKELVKSDSRIRMIKAALQIIVPNFFDIFSFIKFETVKQSALSFVYEMVRTVIEFREKTGTVRNDIMQLLIQLKNGRKVDDNDDECETSGGSEICLTMDEVVAQAYTYFFVGSETASSALAMLVYECALNKQIQYQLQDDIDNGLATSEGKITYEAILEMKYLNMKHYENIPLWGFYRGRQCKVTLFQI